MLPRCPGFSSIASGRPNSVWPKRFSSHSPGAVIATAMGLFAAIPAVYFYNHLTTRVKGFAAEMDDFALEFLNIAERNFT